MIYVTHHKDNSISFNSTVLEAVQELADYYRNIYPITYSPKLDKFYIRVTDEENSRISEK